MNDYRLNDVSIASRGTLEVALARAESAQRPGARVGKQFEALLSSLLVKEVRSTLENGFFGESTGADTFNGWIDDHVGRMIAERGDLGLARVVDGEIARRVGAEAPGDGAEAAQAGVEGGQS
jgi:Rod binding domain-containing protein